MNMVMVHMYTVFIKQPIQFWDFCSHVLSAVLNMYIVFNIVQRDMKYKNSLSSSHNNRTCTLSGVGTRSYTQ